MWRALSLCLFGIFLYYSAQAEEVINRFDVAIEVEKDGDIVVSELITVTSEGRQIRRGIFRDLPRYYFDEKTEGQLPYRYKVISILRDGEPEPYEILDEGNAKRIRIGQADYFLPDGQHTYFIRYQVKNEVRYRENFDEIYWNATGNYWNFPIEAAKVTLSLPQGATVLGASAYTGRLGEAGSDYIYRTNRDDHAFEVIRRLAPSEGMSVSLTLEKGVISPPSWADLGWLWWARNGSLTILATSLFALILYYYRSFDRVGRDPEKGPVFPRYEAPEGYDPAAVHHIFYRGFRGHNALIATLMHLASKGYLTINTNKRKKKLTTLTSQQPETELQSLTPEAGSLYASLFNGRSNIRLGEKYDAGFTSAYTAFRKKISGKYGNAYFKWNLGYLIVGVGLSVGAIIISIFQAHNWSLIHTIAILSIVGLNGLFMYLLPAPTRKGQSIRTEIEGFRLYMETAEKLQMNAVKIGSDAPPPMTKQRYETFLPYAIALGVEKPWSKHFERLIPEEAKNYDPSWTNMSPRSFGSIGGMTDGIVSGMSSGVASAMPQSSGSSGSGGGGFSGGGGGGGGGGGW